MAIVVVLPAPLPPSSPTVAPDRHREVDVVDRQGLAVALGQVLHPDGIHGGGIVPRSRRRGELAILRMAA